MRKFLLFTLLLLFASILIPSVSTQTSFGMEWGVEENDRIYYDVIEKQVYLGETTTITARVYIEIQYLPELVNVNDTIPSAHIDVYYENGTHVPFGGNFAYMLVVYPIGNFSYFQERLVTSGTSGPDEYETLWLEDSGMWGTQFNYASVVATINSTRHLSKSDGAITYYKYSVIDRSSDIEIQSIQIVRVNDTLLILVTGSAAIAIICVVIIVERRRRLR